MHASSQLKSLSRVAQCHSARRPKWVDVLGHTQHGHLRLFVLLLPWEHLLASASSKTQTAALFAYKKSERGGCSIDGNVAASAAVTGAAAEEGKIISSTNKTFLRTMPWEIISKGRI